jgi:hypothetical protein
MLRRYFLLFVFMGITSVLHAQSYSYDDVLKKADKAITSFMPKHLLSFTRLYYSPYYSADGGEQQYYLLEQGKRTEGKLSQVTLRYRLKLKYLSCPVYDSIETIIEIALDKHLKLLTYKGVDVIPDFVMKNLPCNLISRKKALEIVKKKGIEATEFDFQIDYDPIEKRFTYSLSGDVIKAADNPETSIVESIVIDAASGEVIENTFR